MYNLLLSNKSHIFRHCLDSFFVSFVGNSNYEIYSEHLDIMHMSKKLMRKLSKKRGFCKFLSN